MILFNPAASEPAQLPCRHLKDGVEWVHLGTCLLLLLAG